MDLSRNNDLFALGCGERESVEGSYPNSAPSSNAQNGMAKEPLLTMRLSAPEEMARGVKHQRQMACWRSGEG